MHRVNHHHMEEVCLSKEDLGSQLGCNTGLSHVEARRQALVHFARFALPHIKIASYLHGVYGYPEAGAS